MTDILDGILNYGLAILLFGWIIISPIVFIWWFYDSGTRDRFTRQHDRIALAVYFGAFLSLLLLLTEGSQNILVFIPDNWGEIAFIPSMLLSCFIAYAFSKYQEIRVENRRLKEDRDWTQTELKNLRQRLLDRSSSANIDGDIEALDELIGKWYSFNEI